LGGKARARNAFGAVSGDAAIDAVAERVPLAAHRHGPETVWLHFYSGTMRLVQRAGNQRLAHAMRYSRQQSAICVSLVDAGWNAAVGQKRGVDGREIAKSDLIVVWGGNPASTQVNLMAHIAEARRERGARLVVVDPYRTATAAIADLRLAPLPGTDGAH